MVLHRATSADPQPDSSGTRNSMKFPWEHLRRDEREQTMELLALVREKPMPLLWIESVTQIHAEESETSG